MKLKKSHIRTSRRVILLSGFISAVVGATIERQPIVQMLSRDDLYFFLAAAVPLSPFMALFAIGGNITLRSSNTPLEMPTSHSNPFVQDNPLPGLHFASEVGIVTGSGMLVAALWCGWHVFLLGIFQLLVGFGWFLGLLWGIRLYRTKIQHSSIRPTLFGR